MKKTNHHTTTGFSPICWKIVANKHRITKCSCWCLFPTAWQRRSPKATASICLEREKTAAFWQVLELPSSSCCSLAWPGMWDYITVTEKRWSRNSTVGTNWFAKPCRVASMLSFHCSSLQRSEYEYHLASALDLVKTKCNIFITKTFWWGQQRRKKKKKKIEHALKLMLKKIPSM